MLPWLGEYSHAKKSKISMHRFQRYSSSNKPAIWLDRSFLAWNLRSRIFPDIAFTQHTENCKVFHFRLFPGKSNDKILWKLKKAPYFQHFGQHFLPIIVEFFFLENPILPFFFTTSWYLLSLRTISEKLMNKFREKLFTEVQTLIDH